MNHRFIMEDALKTAGVFAGLGAVCGLLAGYFKERTRLSDKKKLTLDLPANVYGIDILRDCIMVLADVRHAHFETLERVGRRCGSLLDLLVSLDAADPATVKLSISTASSQMFESITKYLGAYFLKSKIHVLEDKDGPHGRQMVPVDRDLKEAHATLLSFLDGIAFDIQMMVKAKMEERAGRIEYADR